MEDAVAAFAPDYVVVANATSSHGAALQALQAAGFAKPVLVEKPLCSSSQPTPARPSGALHVGYNLRFHPALQALRNSLHGQRVVSADIHCGSWLPDWRPGRDYAKTSSASRASGGGALHDLSHELDYANWLFGPCRRVAAIGGHLSDLAIETDDVMMILAEMARCPAVTISLNYVERTPRRGAIVNTSGDTFSLDLRAGTLNSARRGPIPVEPFVLDDTYIAQHRAAIDGNTGSLCTYDQGLAVVSMMKAIERAVATATWTRYENVEKGA